MTSHSLTGLDGQNPLGFLAALGLLRVLDDHARARGAGLPTLAYTPDAATTPTLTSDLNFEEIVSQVLADAREQASNVALQFAYTDAGERAHPEEPGAIRDLKAPPRRAKELLKEASAAPRRVSDLAAAFFSELVTDNSGKTKPTTLHFTAGQQTFLAAVEALRAGVKYQDIQEALLGPWLNTASLPSLSWDASSSRTYALRANNPSDEKRGCQAGANWLATVGLVFFPVVANAEKLPTTSSEKLMTTTIVGGWKNSVMRWPLWTGALTTRVVASLLKMDLRVLTASQRGALGISQVFRSRINRSDQGGYGSFSPAAVELPALE